MASGEVVVVSVSRRQARKQDWVTASGIRETEREDVEEEEMEAEEEGTVVVDVSLCGDCFNDVAGGMKVVRYITVRCWLFGC